MLAALILTFALAQEPAVLDSPVYEDSANHVSLPRPFDDWVFAPATARGTTTIIFQPRSAALSDQLWGVLVITHFGRPVQLAGVVDRRVRTWRPTLGSTFVVRARDSLDVDGWPAVHLLLGGAINRAVLDIEEYLVARDSELIMLQLRYPRGVPRDSIAAGFRRVVDGLRIRRRGVATQPAHPVTANPASFTVQQERGQVRFDLPVDLMAVAPGALVSDGTAAGRRIMWWRPIIGDLDTALYAIGRYRQETRREGRLTLHIWRQLSGDSLARATDSTLALIVRDWRSFWLDFGPVPATDLTIVETSAAATRGGPLTIFLGRDATPYVIAREISRTWWGGIVPPNRRNDRLVRIAFPDWAASLVSGQPASSPESRALEAARLSAGDATFREAVRTFYAESRDGSSSAQAFLGLLGPIAGHDISQLIQQQ